MNCNYHNGLKQHQDEKFYHTDLHETRKYIDFQNYHKFLEQL